MREIDKVLAAIDASLASLDAKFAAFKAPGIAYNGERGPEMVFLGGDVAGPELIGISAFAKIGRPTRRALRLARLRGRARRQNGR